MSILSLFSHAGHDHSSFYAPNGAISGETYAMDPRFLLFALALIAITYVIFAALLSRLFKKAGVASWKAWVPIYNSWILLELGGQKGYWAALMVVPFVNFVSIVFVFIAAHTIGLKLGKTSAFVLLAIFLPVVWLAWLALDDSKWKGKTPRTS